MRRTWPPRSGRGPGISLWAKVVGPQPWTQAEKLNIQPRNFRVTKRSILWSYLSAACHTAWTPIIRYPGPRIIAKNHSTNVKRPSIWPEQLLAIVCAQTLLLCPTLCDSMDHSLPGSCVHEIFLARILEWVATLSSGRSSWPRDRTRISCIVGRFFTAEPPRKPCSHQQPPVIWSDEPLLRVGPWRNGAEHRCVLPERRRNKQSLA